LKSTNYEIPHYIIIFILFLLNPFEAYSEIGTGELYYQRCRNWWKRSCGM